MSSILTSMDLSPEVLTPLIASVSDKYFTAHLNQKKKNDEEQLKAINNTLEQWSDQITNEIRKYSKVSNAERAALAIEDAFVDVKDRQTKLIDEIKDTHKKQLDILKNAIAEERYEANQCQQIFEDTLYTKYEHMVTGLQEKIKLEQELSMKRALNELERSARLESDTMKQSYELQQMAEVAMSNKLKTIVSDLRKSWEEEELLRAKQLGERLRNHYTTVLEHMEAQLQMALKLQQEADEQWMEDVELRNKQQIHMMHLFEEKCRRMYETRFNQYKQRTEEQLAQYEEQLLEVGSQFSNEKSMFESKQKTLKLDYEHWKMEYIGKEKDEMTKIMTEMDMKYDADVKRLTEELESLRQKTLILQNQLIQTEKMILERDVIIQQQQQQQMMNNHVDNKSSNNFLSTEEEDSIPETDEMITRKKDFQDRLVSHWEELKTPVADRLTALVSLLDTAPLTPRLIKKYNMIISRLTAQLPIVHLTNRKKYVDFKLKMNSMGLVKGNHNNNNDNNNNSSVNKEVHQELQQESDQLQVEIDNVIYAYEQQYKVSFVMPPAVTTAYTGASGSLETTLASASNTTGGIQTASKDLHRYTTHNHSSSIVNTNKNTARSKIDDTRAGAASGDVSSSSSNSGGNNSTNTTSTPSLNKSSLYFRK